MFSKIRISFGLVLLVSLLFAIPAFAGGWAVITLDEAPTEIVAGEPLTIGFMVLQHGKTPMVNLDPTVKATLPNGEQFTVNADPEGKPGHYTATLIFSREGDWSWSIQAFTMDQPMPGLRVSAPVAKVTGQSEPVSKLVTMPISPLLVLRVVTLGFGLAGLVFVFRRKSRLTLALTVTCLLIGIGTFLTESSVPTVDAQNKSSSKVANATPMSQVEIGERLFITKGCVTCHVNKKISLLPDYQATSVGAPSLTSFSASPEILRMRLKDPESVKTDTWMPNLNLSDSEIEALIKFINSK